jgi:hypothetical protein
MRPKERETMKSKTKSVLYHPTASQFQSAVFGFTDKSSLKSSLGPAETDGEIRQSVLSVWTNDREAQKLAKSAYALGVGKIVVANRDIDEDDFQGQYICARDSRVSHEKSLKSWNPSPRQLATVNRALRSDRDVILLNESYNDFAATLAHELGHYINRRLGGLSRFELSIVADFSRVTDNMRRVARFGEYFFKNKDEYYAETWSRFLCGEKKRSLFRYLKRPLGRLRMEHPQKARLILELAKTISCNRTGEIPGHLQ